MNDPMGPFPVWLWLVIALLSLALGLYLMSRQAQKDAGNDPEPIDRIMRRDPLSTRRYCDRCAEQDLIVSFEDDAGLAQHLHERHGDS
jgi:hypothetical protein